MRKACEMCGADYEKRRSEAYWQFEARQFCSKSCATRARNPRLPNSEFKARYRQVVSPDGRRMLEHRWVMEQQIGRPLSADEQVHHINHDRLDNRPENLELVTSAEHGLRHTSMPITKECQVCKKPFTPHKTKRRRAKTCGPKCAQVLRSASNGRGAT